jgi:PAS domain S-box-containing protein
LDLYRLLVERLHDFAVFLTDTEGRITSWHPGVQNLLGYSEAEFIGQPIVNIFTPEDRAAGAPERELARALRDGEAPDIRWHLRKDGRRVYVEGSFVALKDSAGTLLGFSKVMRDITERKRMEDDLRRSERRHAVLLLLLAQQRETTDPALMMQTTAEAMGHYLNADRVGFFELSPDDMLQFRSGWTAGRLPLLTQPFPASGIGTRYLAEVRAGRTLGIPDVSADPLTADSRFAEIGTASLIGAPILRRGRWCAGLYVNHSEPRVWTEEEVSMAREVADLTWDAVERVRAEEARGATEEQLALSIEAADGIGTWNWDLATDRVYSSARFARIFAISAPDAAAGVPISRFVEAIHPDDRDPVNTLIQKAIDTAGPYAADFRVIQPDGSERWLHALGHAYKGAKGHPDRFPGAAIDITELKAMERELRRSEEFNRRILESTRDCVKVLSLGGALISINPRGQHELGMEDVAPYLNRSWFSFWTSPADRTKAEEAIRCAGAGRDAQFEGSFADLRGHVRWWDSRITPILGDNGKPERLLVISRDITERKRVEDELKQARDEATRILESITDGFFVLDSEWRFIYANRAAEALMGFARDEMLGVSHWDLFPGSLATVVESAYREAVREQKAVEFENYYEPWQRWFSVKAAPAQKGGLSVFFREITDQKKADEELHRQWHLFDTVLSHTPDHNYVFSLEGAFLYANRAVLSLLGLPLDRVRGKTFAELNYPEELALRLNRQILQIAATAQPIADQTVFTGADGETRDFEYIMVPVIGADGKVEAVAGSTRDITDQKRAEEHERERQAQFLDSARLESLGIMAGGIAHDFNNLLVGVLGNASLLLETISPTDRPLAGEIVLAAERAAELTRQMLAYSGKGHFSIEIFDLNTLIQENLTLLRATLSRNVTVELEFGCAACLVEADRAQIQQVVMNLLINASEAVGDSPGKVLIRTELEERREPRFNSWLHSEVPAGTYAVLEVRDTGSGMTPETMKKIFDPFFTTKFTGRGLGLAAVLGIVKGHLGDIEVESEPGKGTSFRVSLAAARAGRAPRRHIDAGTPSDSAGKTVLVVDDEDIVRRMAAAALRTRGYGVMQAVNGAEALDLLRTTPGIAAIILDLTMPVMTGEQALPLIRAEFPSLPIILSSGFGEAEILRRFASSGIAGVLQKPYTVASIVSRVTEALEK